MYATGYPLSRAGVDAEGFSGYSFRIAAATAARADSWAVEIIPGLY
jgi:hypothetical protein